ncbi:MAG: DNA alkylation repair protein [Chthoniobacterales bacterium]|nr:DNA alkylation repair protein [Chthoniobacterales bacterium]
MQKAASRKKHATDVVRPIDEEVRAAVAWLERRGSKRNREGMARYAIRSKCILGVSVADLRGYAKELGRNHRLALALWKTGIYEARMLAAFVAEPERVTPALMDRWARDFDNWAICDTVCFHLFDRTPHAFAKVTEWIDAHGEFVRRAAFALLASVAGHDKTTGDQPFLRGLRLVKRAASDDRNFVKKAVSWALRRIGQRNRALHAAAMEVARSLAGSTERTPRWIGQDALRDLTSATTMRLKS